MQSLDERMRIGLYILCRVLCVLIGDVRDDKWNNIEGFAVVCVIYSSGIVGIESLCGGA